MITSELVYEGELRTRATHVYSGTKIFTDAPLDNNGKAQSFSPTDLVATALASCMMTIMGIQAARHELHLEGSTITVHKFMASDPRRIIKVKIAFEISGSGINEEKRKILEDAGINCPVAKSLHPDIEQEVTFKYV